MHYLEEDSDEKMGEISFLAVLTCMVLLILASCGKEELEEVKVGEVTRSSFMHHNMLQLKKDFLKKKD